MGFLGAKSASGAFQAIIASMPPHDVYIESHLGTGAVMRRKPPATRSIGIDRDPAVLAVFETAYTVELYEGDCLAFLQSFDFAKAGRVLIYHDPPYLLSTRTSRRRYRCDYTEADHVRLLAACRELPALQMVSGYPSPFYDEQLLGWRTLEFQVMTRGGPRTEKLWMNYAERAQWSTFAGRNFTDRQRIKRKAARWADHYRRLPPGERLAVLAALLEVEAERMPAAEMRTSMAAAIDADGSVGDIDAGGSEGLIDVRVSPGPHRRGRLGRPG